MPITGLFENRARATLENTGQINIALMVAAVSKQICGAWWMASPLIFNKRNKWRSAMTEERRESDLADIILSLCVDDSSPDGWVTVEQVQPEMTKRGYTLPNNELTDARGWSPLPIIGKSNKRVMARE